MPAARAAAAQFSAARRSTSEGECVRAAVSADFYRSVSTPSSPLPFPFLSLVALSARGFPGWLDNGARERSAAGAAEVPAEEAGHCRRCVLLQHTFLLFSVGIAACRASAAPAR